MLPDVMAFIGWGEYFRLINVVYPEGFQNLRLNEVPDAALSHDRYRYRLHDSLDD